MLSTIILATLRYSTNPTVWPAEGSTAFMYTLLEVNKHAGEMVHWKRSNGIKERHQAGITDLQLFIFYVRITLLSGVVIRGGCYIFVTPQGH